MKTNLRLGEMILSDDEIMAINQTAEFDSAIGYARAIEAKVLEKLSDKLRDAERYRWLRDESFVEDGIWIINSTPFHLDQAIDTAIKESK